MYIDRVEFKSTVHGVRLCRAVLQPYLMLDDKVLDQNIRFVKRQLLLYPSWVCFGNRLIKMLQLMIMMIRMALLMVRMTMMMMMMMLMMVLLLLMMI